MKRIINRLWAIIFAAFIALAVFPTGALAVSYDDNGRFSSITVDIADHIIVRTGFQNAIRSLGFGILKFLASLIDYIYEAVTKIASYNLYDLVKKEFNFDSYLVPLAWSVLSLIIVFIAIRLLLKSDVHIGEDALKFFICIGLIIIFPALLAACNDMRTKLVSDAEEIAVSEQTLGNEILERYIIDVDKSVNAGDVVYYADGTYNTDGNELYINKVFDNSQFTIKISDDPREAAGITGKGAYSFDMILQSMGLIYKYADYIEALETDTIIQTKATYTEVHNDDGTVDKEWSYQEYTAEEYADKVILPIAKRSGYNDWLKKNISFDGTSYSSWSEYETALKEAINKKMESGTGKDNVSIHDAEGNPTGRYIAMIFNDSNVEDLLYVPTPFSIDTIGITFKGYFEYLARYIKTLGYPAENVYCYDFDFGYCIITMLAVLISLTFAALKLGKMLYELVFLEIISPVFIALDSGSWQGQKTKQVVTSLITTSAMFSIIILIFKLYLIVLLQIYKEDLSIAMQIVLVISGAAFVIDGPDFIVKILGMDAGVKSGYGAFRGAEAAVRTTAGAARGTGNVAKKIVNAPSAVAAKAGESKARSMARKDARNQARVAGKGFIGQTLAGAKAGLSNGRTGSAFKKAASDHTRANTEYNDNKEKSRDLKAQAHDYKANNAAPIDNSAKDTDGSQAGSIADVNNNSQTPVNTNDKRPEEQTVNSVSSGSSNSTSGENGSSAADTNTSSSPAETTNTSGDTVNAAPSPKSGKGITGAKPQQEKTDAKPPQERKYPIQYADESKLFYDRDSFDPFSGTEYFDSSKEE